MLAPSGKMPSISLASSFLILILCLTSIVQWVSSTLRPKAYPPGPPVTPGLGNLLQIPVQKPYLQFHKWAKQYGDMVGLKTGAGNLVILNNPKLVHELFDKRGAIYSNRRVSHILTKYVHPGPEEKSIAILQYDEYYQRWRRSFQFILSTAGIKRVTPLLEAEASRLTLRLLDGGKGYEAHLRYWSLAVPLVATSGESLDDMAPGYAEQFFHTQEEVLQFITPGAAPPVDVFPVLRYVPGFLAPWKQEAREARKHVLADANKFLHGGKKQFEQLRRDPSSVGFVSLIASILDQQNTQGKSAEAEHFTDTELAFIGQAAVGAAVDTTAATIKSLLLILAAYPAVLTKLQQEVDAVAGDSAPTSEHIKSLPYLKACWSETLRWRPTTPSALPHVLAKEDRVGDYVFPAGTSFIANAWTIHRDESLYDRPEEFVPERWLDNAYGVVSAALAKEMETSGRRKLYAFGSGRRQCPGQQFAFVAVLLAVSKLVWAYDILPPGPGAVDVSIETGFQSGVVSAPLNPQVVFRLRTMRGSMPFSRILKGRM